MVAMMKQLESTLQFSQSVNETGSVIHCVDTTDYLQNLHRYLYAFIVHTFICSSYICTYILYAGAWLESFRGTNLCIPKLYPEKN